MKSGDDDLGVAVIQLLLDQRTGPRQNKSATMVGRSAHPRRCPVKRLPTIPRTLSQTVQLTVASATCSMTYNPDHSPLESGP
jgi:hypothetical protein